MIFDLDLDLDVWDVKAKHLEWDVLQKSTFAEVVFFIIPGFIVHGFECP